LGGREHIADCLDEVKEGKRRGELLCFAGVGAEVLYAAQSHRFDIIVSGSPEDCKPLVAPCRGTDSRTMTMVMMMMMIVMMMIAAAAAAAAAGDGAAGNDGAQSLLPHPPARSVMWAINVAGILLPTVAALIPVFMHQYRSVGPKCFIAAGECERKKRINNLFFHPCSFCVLTIEALHRSLPIREVHKHMVAARFS
jgi:hypothetical protein